MRKHGQELILQTIRFPQRIFQPLPLRSIGGDPDHTLRLSRDIEQRRLYGCVDPRSIDVRQNFFKLDGPAFAQDAAVVTVKHQGSGVGEHIIDRPATRFAIHNADEFFERPINVHKPSVRIDQRNEGGRVLKDRA